MIAGIDGIHITTNQFAIRNIATLKENKWRYGGGGEIGEEQKILIKDTYGNDVRANRIYNNSTGLAHFDISPFGLLVHFNPSKILHSYNLISTGKELNYIAKSVQKEAQKIGIDVDIDGAKLTRIDIAKQATMKYEVQQYASAFRLLHAKRRNKKEVGTTYYFENTKKEAVFYDKGAEAGIDEVNFMRGEIKYKDTKTTAKATSINTLSQLLEASNEEINSIYVNELSTNIFCRKNIGFQSVLDFNSEVQIMKSFIEKSKRGAWMQYLALHNIDEVLNDFGGIEKFIDCWSEAGYKRRQLFKMKSDIKQMINKKSFLDGRRKKVTATALLDEVYQKFA